MDTISARPSGGTGAGAAPSIGFQVSDTVSFACLPKNAFFPFAWILCTKNFLFFGSQAPPGAAPARRSSATERYEQQLQQVGDAQQSRTQVESFFLSPFYDAFAGVL